MTIAELKALLAPFPDTATVVVTWESVIDRDPEVYAHKDGTVMIDADAPNAYRARYESGESPLDPEQ